MNTLTYDALDKSGYEGYLLREAPERILQFGEGNFLRAFVDCFVDIANEACGFDSKVLLVQPIPEGTGEAVNRQEGLYTLYLRGMEEGRPVSRKRIVSCVSRCLNPWEDYAALLQAAHSPHLRFVVSNTTEAGIVFDPAAGFDDAPPAGFPAKLTRFLYERYTALGPEGGLVVLPCELIDDNGGELRRCVERHAAAWGLPGAFSAWLEEQVLFCSTLVDRIVTGYPREEAEALCRENGYRDDLLDTAEVFGLWVVEGPDSLREELPLAQAGLPVIVTDDYKPYKERKVRILNGAHTTMALAAFLAGKDTVGQCMEDPAVSAFLRRAVFEEIIPTLTLPREELETFAGEALERFRNPFIRHSLLAVSLNSVSKWRARVLPTMETYIRRRGEVPVCLAFGLAALIRFYSGELKAGKMTGLRQGEPYTVADDLAVLEFFALHGGEDPAALAAAVCGNRDFWGADLNRLPGLADAVAQRLTAIRDLGMAGAMEALPAEGREAVR